MRFHLAISVLGVLAMSVAPVGAQSPTTLSGLNRRVGTDGEVCAALDGAFKVPITIGVETELVTVGNIYVCACVSAVADIVNSNPITILAVAETMGDVDAVTNALTNMILANGEPCEYPTGAIQTCEMNNPCGYTCSNGLSVDPQTGDCVCASPNVMCNGQCASSCPSAASVPLRRAASPFDRVANRRQMCPRGFTPCGIFEQRGQVSEPWDCVDVRYELESCGGCMTPFDDLSPRGVDCTALPGVADVSCMRGSCVVRRCLSGYAVTADGSRCVPTRR